MQLIDLGNEDVEAGMLVVPAELVDVVVSAECFAVVLDVIQIRFVLCRPPQPRRSPQQLILSETHTRQDSCLIKLVLRNLWEL